MQIELTDSTDHTAVLVIMTRDIIGMIGIARIVIIAMEDTDLATTHGTEAGITVHGTHHTIMDMIITTHITATIIVTIMVDTIGIHSGIIRTTPMDTEIVG